MTKQRELSRVHDPIRDVILSAGIAEKDNAKYLYFEQIHKQGNLQDQVVLWPIEKLPELLRTLAFVFNLPAGFLLPDGFRYTGEWRLPKKDEIFLQPDGAHIAAMDFSVNAWPILERL